MVLQRYHLGLASATFGALAAITALAYALTRRRPLTVSTGALSETTLMLGPYISKGAEELSRKDLKAIQRETALTWTGRACAAARMGNFQDAREYAHEGLEHAALSGDMGVFEEIRTALDRHSIEV